MGEFEAVNDRRRESLLPKRSIQRSCESCKTSERKMDVPSIVHEVLNSPGKPLDREVKEFMESRFGYDFSKVQIHTDAKAAESAQAINALSFTYGNKIAFAAGQYEYNREEGRKILTHELAHFIQQERHNYGNPSRLSISGANDSAEREADNVASIVSSGTHMFPHLTDGIMQVREVAPENQIQRAVPVVVSTIGAGIGAVNVGQSLIQNQRGGLSYSSEQLTYPKDKKQISKDMPTVKTQVAHFRSSGYVSDNDTTFAIIGDFGEDMDEKGNSTPFMANVFIDLGKTTTYYESKLSFNARGLQTAFGSAKDPRIRFSCTGEFDPAGPGHCFYQALIEVNRHGSVNARDLKITSGKGNITPFADHGFELTI
jgi:hypothetical protein